MKIYTVIVPELVQEVVNAMQAQSAAGQTVGVLAARHGGSLENDTIRYISYFPYQLGNTRIPQ